MKDFSPLLALLAGGVLASVLAAPNPNPNANPGDSDFEDVFYDQRQNGSENFRIHLNDVMVVVAPAEALLSVAGSDLLGGNGGTNPTETGGVLSNDELVTPDRLWKDCKSGGSNKIKCQKPQNNNKRSRLRLSNLLMPFINRAHH